MPATDAHTTDKQSNIPAPNPVKDPKPEKRESALNATDIAAMDTLLSELDDNYKSSYDLSKMTSQVREVFFESNYS